MKNKKYWLITSLVTLLPILVGLMLWDQLPDKLPTHFGIDGAADGWGSKAFAVFGIPVMFLVFQLIIWAVTGLDKQNQGHNRKVLELTGLIFPAMSLFCALLMYTRSMEIELDMTRILFLLLGLLFIAIGNWLPKVKQNSTLGIKIKWTLYSEENWNKTHRFAGFVWVIGGILFCLMGFVPEKGLYWLLPLQLVLLAGLPMVYSWRLAKKQQAAGTWTESETHRRLRQHPMLLAVSTVLVSLILIGVGIVMFTGDIDYRLTGDALVIEADYHEDLTVPYDVIDSAEYRNTAPEGLRDWGFASARLLMGLFENEEFGSYTRYTYLGCESCIVLRSGDEVLVLNARDEAATLALYEAIAEVVSK